MDEHERQSGAPPLTTPANPLADATVALARERFADSILEVVEHRGEMTLVVTPEALIGLCQALRDAPGLRYDFLADIAAVDWLAREPRYDVVYHLLSLQTRAVVRLKVRAGGEASDEPELPTVTGVWSAADWFEREIYDLFGIRFSGHPDLTRILMPSDWVGHPLRKDYPLTGIRLPEPHWGGQVAFEAPLPAGTGQQTLRAPDATGDVASADAPPELWPEPERGSSGRDTPSRLS
jgi:NADH-quinone oxidoreductase subunit C